MENGNALISASVSGEDGDKHPSLLFYNHYDVVEEGKHELWSNEPFRPMIRDGVLYGRGVSDFPENNQKSLKNYRKQTSACGKMGAAMKKEDHGRDSASGEV